MKSVFYFTKNKRGLGQSPEYASMTVIGREVTLGRSCGKGLEENGQSILELKGGSFAALQWIART